MRDEIFDFHPVDPNHMTAFIGRSRHHLLPPKGTSRQRHLDDRVVLSGYSVVIAPDWWCAFVDQESESRLLDQRQRGQSGLWSGRPYVYHTLTGKVSNE